MGAFKIGLGNIYISHQASLPSTYKSLLTLLTLLLAPPSPPQNPLRQRPVKRRHQRGAQNDKSNRGPNRPEERLAALHVPQITRVHAQIARHEGQGQEDDRDDGEDDDGFVVGFGFEGYGLSGEEARGLGLDLEFVEVVDALGDGFDDAVEDGDGEGGHAVGDGHGGFEFSEGVFLLQ